MLPRIRLAARTSGQQLEIRLRSELLQSTSTPLLSFEFSQPLRRIEKCIRILKVFTEEGVQQTESKEVTDPQTGQKVKKSRKVLKKIPSNVIRQAKGCDAQLLTVHRAKA